MNRNLKICVWAAAGGAALLAAFPRQKRLSFAVGAMLGASMFQFVESLRLLARREDELENPMVLDFGRRAGPRRPVEETVRRAAAGAVDQAPAPEKKPEPPARDRFELVELE